MTSKSSRLTLTLTLVLSLAVILILAFVTASASSASDCEPEAASTLWGKVFADANANGVFDDGEVGTEAVTMVLYSDSDGDGRPGEGDSVLDSQSTDWYGDYGFQVCTSGAFLIEPDDQSLPKHQLLSTVSFAAVSFDGVGQVRDGINFGHAKKRLVENQVIVGFQDGTPPERIQEIVNGKGIVPLWEVPGINAWVVATADVDKQIEKFLTMPEVKWAEPNFVGGAEPEPAVQAQGTAAQDTAVQSTAAQDLVAQESPAELGALAAEPDAIAEVIVFPNDPDYNDPAKGYGPRQINAPPAWETTTGSTGVIVAVVDSGVSPLHPELSAVLLPGKDFINNDLDASDDNGHGTHVAGIIAAAMNNGQGLAGIAPGIRILPVKVLNSANLGDYATFAAGINYAVQNGARIINLSLGGPSDSQALHDAVQAAANQGVLVVVASGNTADNRAYYPASYPEAFSVAGSTTAGEWWSSSTFNNEVDITAPAQRVWSTYWRSTNPGDYAFLDGTSMAAPFASVAAALLLSNRPDLRGVDLRDILQQSARDLGRAGVDYNTGYGLLDLGAAIGVSGAWAPATPTPLPTATPTLTPTPTMTPTPLPPPFNLTVDAGGAAYQDGLGQWWQADQAYTAGSWGYTGGATKSYVTVAVNGTAEDLLYQNYREQPGEYRVTAPSGAYDVTLKFAEFEQTRSGTRVMSVRMEGAVVDASLDVYKLAGKATALDKVYRVNVSDGVLNIAFAQNGGKAAPMVSAIQVKNAAPLPTPTVTPTATPYAQRVNAGGAAFSDLVAQSWTADKAYAAGSWGYVSGSAKSSSTAVNGTTDDGLYQKYREGMKEYTYTVPNGTYLVTLKFAEFGTTTVGDRVMNIAIEGLAVETGLDIYKQAGKATALDKTYVTTVNDGVLNITFGKASGRKAPIVSAIGVVIR